ncbi:aspartic peptidase domain-containing protein [Emericellopsis atlantica]|uniref:Aspartic peptidase domain-containing protein n=1 Tax=Emericellopsis atlantica TaxID=2614577 RepID=A0A9P8CP13_9HYPO|nr:aspartic peptidase domain-containing protein [Emericellopsis atlantica]KAG9254354.1 aspartic peptidase domain-containing protein [Emericellopsis atlantica]
MTLAADEGNDGPWSSFDIRVGSPEQDVRVLVSTAAPETLVVLAEHGCSKAVFEDVPADCAVSRGDMFSPDDSSTWDPLGIFQINGDGVGLEANLGYVQRAQFGLDNVSIGLVDGGGSLGLSNQTIGGIATASPFYLGIFGINNQPLNFSTLGNFSSPSFITTLKDQGAIPSLSWSYTAGAIYRAKKVYGQLIFSGYDTSRFKANDVSFTIADDVTRDLVVALQAITYSGEDKRSLLSEPINIYIDSTDPNLWLPEDAVRNFESAFDLTLDDSSGLYLVNESHHSTLLESGAEVSFRLSDVLQGGSTTTITLPYKAFDLQAEYPLVDNTSYYFPLKQAVDESQYTLGRAFLQEAYITADYERRVFNVSQCQWAEGKTANIITITSKDTDTDAAADADSSSNTSNSGSASESSPTETVGEVSTSSRQTSMGSGTVAGIVVGSLAAVGLVSAALFLLLRRRKRASSSDGGSSPSRPESSAVTLGPGSPEMDGEPKEFYPRGEELAGDTTQVYQLHSDPKETVAVAMEPEEPQVYELSDRRYA